MATPTTTHERRRAASGRPDRDLPCVDSPYCLEDFLDDQCRVMKSARPGLTPPVRRIAGVDGRMLVIDVDRLRSVARGSSQTVQVFLDKYGRGAGEHRLAQFRCVVDFLAERGGDIRFAGLAESREPLRVQEEFVKYLLDRRVEPEGETMPEGVLRRFLDDWGHRWM